MLAAITAITTLYFVVAKCRRAAWIQLSAFLSDCLAMGILKIAFIGCGLTFFHFSIYSPSGHASLSFAVLGTLTFILSSQYTGWRKVLPLACAAGLILAVAASRVILHRHSLAEVLMGLAVGGGVATLHSYLWVRKPSPPIRFRELSMMVGCVAIGLNGVNMPAEELIRLISAHLRNQTNACQTLPSLTARERPIAPGQSKVGVVPVIVSSNAIASSTSP